MRSPDSRGSEPHGVSVGNAPSDYRMSSKGFDAAKLAYTELRRWLLEEAYPVWAQWGWDAALGGFHERLGRDGPAIADARRVRVQWRQIYCFARAAALGWQGSARPLVSGGLDHVFARYQRHDGLFLALLGADGAVLEERALLYDQAFALLALAAAHGVLGASAGCAARAAALWECITGSLRAPLGFRADSETAGPLLANPHMHLLEALLAWADIDDPPRWRRRAEAVVTLALERLIDPASGALRERYEPQPAAGDPRGDPIEPGHQFEWAGLLLRFDSEQARLRDTALRLAEIAETHGVRAGFTVNALHADLTVLDPEARLWPQTERVKTLARLARLTGEVRCWGGAAQAAEALRAYFTMARGLWYDRRMPDGSFVPEPSPASSFYHIVGAIDALGRALGER